MLAGLKVGYDEGTDERLSRAYAYNSFGDITAADRGRRQLRIQLRRAGTADQRMRPHLQRRLGAPTASWLKRRFRLLQPRETASKPRLSHAGRRALCADGGRPPVAEQSRSHPSGCTLFFPFGGLVIGTHHKGLETMNAFIRANGRRVTFALLLILILTACAHPPPLPFSCANFKEAYWAEFNFGIDSPDRCCLHSGPLMGY